MTTEEIKKMHERASKKARRYYDDFQNGASSQYYSHYRRESDIAWLCEQALKGSEDRDAAITFKIFFSKLFEMADRAIYKNTSEAHHEVLRAIMDFGQYELNMKRRYQ